MVLGRHGDTLDLAGASFRCTLVPPVRFHTAWTMVTGLAVLALLVHMLHPELEDFRTEMFDIYVLLAVLLGGSLLLLVVPRRPWLAGVVVAAAFAMTLTLSRSPRVRIVAHEYARVGSLVANSWLILVEKGGGRSRTNRYVLSVPPWGDEAG